MKDREKQIEEMAKDKQWQRRDSYCLRIQKALQYKGTDDREDVPSILVDFENKIRKEILLEDSVVLSREEYEKKKKHLQNVLELSNSQLEKEIEENKKLRKLLGVFDKLPSKELKKADEVIEMIKQQTYKRAIDEFEVFFVNNMPTREYMGIFYKQGIYTCGDFRKLKKEFIAKQFGVEIKE